MPRSKKPPTLAELRKLAKRKGYGFTKVYRLPQEAGDARVLFYATISELGGSTTIDATSSSKARVAVVLFAALSALPDATKTRKASR